MQKRTKFQIRSDAGKQRWVRDDRKEAFWRKHIESWERSGDAIRFNETLTELAGHYRFEPVPVNVARGNEKGRVERAISYIRKSFFAAREYSDLDDLNRQALDWCRGVAAERRCAEDRCMTVAQAFELERPNLLLLPDNQFPVYEKCSVRVGKTPYIRFDLNDYSVPYTLVRKTLQVVADLERVRVMNGLTEVACHRRSWDKGAQIEDRRHIEELIERKQGAKKHRGMDRLRHASPTVAKILQLAAQRGQKVKNWEKYCNQDWLPTFLQEEEAERAQRSMDRRIREAKLGQFKPMSDFDWRWPKKIDRELIDELFSLQFLDGA